MFQKYSTNPNSNYEKKGGGPVVRPRCVPYLHNVRSNLSEKGETRYNAHKYCTESMQERVEYWLSGMMIVKARASASCCTAFEEGNGKNTKHARSSVTSQRREVVLADTAQRTTSWKSVYRSKLVPSANVFARRHGGFLSRLDRFKLRA